MKPPLSMWSDESEHSWFAAIYVAAFAAALLVSHCCARLAA